MAAWKGGKHNDILLVYGLNDDGLIVWFQSASYGKGIDNRYLHDSLRAATQGEQLTQELIDTQLARIAREFRPVDPAQFAHLKDAVKIPWWLILVVMVVNICVSLGTALYMSSKTVFGKTTYQRNNRRWR